MKQEDRTVSHLSSVGFFKLQKFDYFVGNDKKKCGDKAKIRGLLRKRKSKIYIYRYMTTFV